MFYEKKNGCILKEAVFIMMHVHRNDTAVFH